MNVNRGCVAVAEIFVGLAEVDEVQPHGINTLIVAPELIVARARNVILLDHVWLAHIVQFLADFFHCHHRPEQCIHHDVLFVFPLQKI